MLIEADASPKHSSKRRSDQSVSRLPANAQRTMSWTDSTVSGKIFALLRRLHLSPRRHIEEP